MPYVTNIAPFEGLGVEHRFYNGHPYDCLFVKATFRITHDNRLLPLIDQPKFVANDVYEGDEDTTALKYPSEIIPFKPGTDVIVIGNAKPRAGEPSEQWLANLRVVRNGADEEILLDKTVRFTGPRTWTRSRLGGWQLSPIESCSAVRLSYANGFGGASAKVEREDDAFWPNPFGRGFYGRDKVDSEREYHAPQILSKDDIELKWGRLIDPIGLSPMDGKQAARLQFAGTYDEAWKENVAPNIPLDMKLDFWNTVPQDQVVSPYLEGGEIIRTIGLFPTVDGARNFALPNFYVTGLPITGRFKHEAMPMHIDTVIIDLDTSHVTIRWATLFSQLKGYEEYELCAIERKAAVAVSDNPAASYRPNS